VVLKLDKSDITEC